LKNFTVPVAIVVPFKRLFVERRAEHRPGGNNPSFGGSLESQPKVGSVSAREAENQVAGAQIDGFPVTVNGKAARILGLRRIQQLVSDAA
jgi:hypothetical protein